MRSCSTPDTPTANPSRTAVGIRLHTTFGERNMYENAADRISLEDVAAHSGVSSRTLRNAFVRHRGVPPTKALLHLRLDGARAELLRGCDRVTITQVASRWGFRELGRFSVAYRKRFDETPSQTLQRRFAPSRS